MTSIITPAALDVARAAADPGCGEPSEPEGSLPEADGLQRSRSLARRFRAVTVDLRLDGILPDGWLVPSTDGLAFNELPFRQADRLIRALEDLAADYEPESPKPGPNQLSFGGDL